MIRFEKFHPAILFIYYLLVIVFSMFTVHPIVLAGTLPGSVLLFALLHPMRETLRNLLFYFFVFILIGITNPLFSHNGETILFFLNDNPITMEAIIYGAVISIMLVGIIFWCKCYTKILTSDKFLYLFGKMIPKLSLILSMTLRLIPLFKQQIKKISGTQKVLGLYSSESRTDALLGRIRVFDSLLSWSLENAIDTADAMKARGYGLKGRSNFHLFRFHKEDGILLAAILILTALIASGNADGVFLFGYYPYITGMLLTKKAILGYLCMLFFMLLPSLLEIKEKILWNCLRSKI